jgi:hypothetical protein
MWRLKLFLGVPGVVGGRASHRDLQDIVGTWRKDRAFQAPWRSKTLSRRRRGAEAGARYQPLHRFLLLWSLPLSLLSELLDHFIQSGMARA